MGLSARAIRPERFALRRGVRTVRAMIIPHDQLRNETLVALIEEFVTRDGALHGHHDVSVQEMSASVLAQLRAGRAVIVFDEESESASIVMKDSLKRSDEPPEEEPA